MKRCVRLAVVLSLSVLLSVSLIFSQEEGYKPKSYTVNPATSVIKIDGILDEQAWADATIGDLPYEWLPGDNIPPPVETDFLITFSADYLYIAMRCYDPEPEQIRAHLMDRDAIDLFIQDDHVVLFMDPFNDERRGFQFRVNPLGVQADANFSELEGYEDFSWDAIWDSAGKIFDWGYVIEVAIPFNQLRFPAGDDVQTWGFSISRSYPRNVRHRLISERRDRNLSCVLCQISKFTGFQGMERGLGLELDPTLTGNRTDERTAFPDGNMEQGDAKVEPGLTLRWGPTPNLIFNGTINPDFSQVEADVAQLDVNTRFALQYPEKRPFFLEGADFFLTPIEAVFTRTVVDPQGGLKLTGKIGRNAFGVFGAYDELNTLLFPSNQVTQQTQIEQYVPSGVFRYRRDVGQGSAVGALYTGRVSTDYFNHVAGLDGFFRLSDTKTVNVQYLRSETKYSEEIANKYNQSSESFGGNAFYLDFTHVSREWIYFFLYNDFSPGFRGDYGYIPRVDYRQAHAQVNYIFWGDNSHWFDRIQVGFQGDAIYDYDKKLTDGEAMLQAQYFGSLQSSVILVFRRKREYYAGIDYDMNNVIMRTEMKPVGGLRFGVSGLYGGAIDYTNQRPAYQLLLIPLLEFNLGRHFNMNFQHNFQYLYDRNAKTFSANLSQARFIYNLNVNTFVRLIIQYLHLDRNQSQYEVPVAEKTETLFTQFLFSYKLNPQTVVFIGYSDNYLGMTDISLTQKDRTFFIKLGYAWIK